MQPHKREVTWNTCVRRLALYACVLLTVWIVSNVAAEPELMTDSELDAVAARGTVDEEGQPVLDLGGILASANPEGTGALFAFDIGSIIGSGGVDLSGLTQPSTLTLNGNLSAAVLQVENLIINLNICSGCKADTIYQLGLGVPITINPAPTQ